MQFIDLKTRHKLIGDKINGRIQKVMDHGQFILGPEVSELENKLAEYTGPKIVLRFRVVQILSSLHSWLSAWGQGMR